MDVRLARLFCVVVAALIAMAIASCSGNSPSCGAKVRNGSGGEWTCTFSDDFDGHTLDSSKWQVAKTSQIGFTQSAGECYVDDPSNVRVAGGMLTLTATKLAVPARCGPTSTPYLSGMVFSKDRFAQAYGRFEVRAKLPRGAGFQPALWMYPQELAYGDRSGEIDIAESFGATDTVSSHLHVHDATGADHPQGADCHVIGASSSFHTYTVEWEPHQIRFLYDGVLCTTIRGWDTGPALVPPQPFDRPFFLLLQLGLGYGVNAPSPTTPFPGRLQIDYVRAWK